MPNPCILGRIIAIAAMDEAFTYSAPAIKRLTFPRAEHNVEDQVRFVQRAPRKTA